MPHVHMGMENFKRSEIRFHFYSLEKVENCLTNLGRVGKWFKIIQEKIGNFILAKVWELIATLFI